MYPNAPFRKAALQLTELEPLNKEQFRLGRQPCKEVGNRYVLDLFFAEAKPLIEVGMKPLLSEAIAEEPALTIVVPVYKSERTIRELVTELSRLPIDGGLEIILVNDASPDASAQVCRQLVHEASVPLTVIEHARNFGEHNAVLTGLRHARGSYVITMDDDMQNPPEAALQLYNCARTGNWDVVYARSAIKNHAAWRNAGSWLANVVADALLTKPKGLYLSSFRCMSSFAVAEVSRYTGPFPYIDGLLMQATDRVTSLEVPHLPRRIGRSSYTFSKLVGLWLNMAMGFSQAPLRLAAMAGAVMSVVGVLFGIALLVNADLRNGMSAAILTSLCIVLLILGAQTMMLGMIGEYVGRILPASGAKPQAVVRSIEKSQSKLSPSQAGRARSI